MKEQMAGRITLPLALLFVLVMTGCKGASRSTGKPGQELFMTYCSGCHPNGTNSIYPQKSLDRSTLAANGITTREGIVAIMRNPGNGMKIFGRDTISEVDARKVADYILETFR